MKTFDGYLKQKFGDTYLLLAGGGEKKLTDLLTQFERPANTNNIQLTVGGTQLTVNLGARAFDDTTYLPLNGGTMTGHITISGQAIYFGKGGSNAILAYNASYPNYGIWYHDDTVDKMSFSASNNANNIANADLCINGNGDGTVTIRGNTIIHAGNISSQSVNYATSAGDADTVDNFHASGLTKFYLSPMTSGAPADSAKSWFTGTMPSASGAIIYNVPGSEKTIIAGKSSGAYGHMLQLNYDDTYLRILRYAASSWKSTDWEKISAGYADSAGSVAWDNVTGKPSTFSPSSHTHDYLPLSGGWMNDGAQVYFKGKSGSTSTYACMGYRSSVTGTMHASDAHNSSGAFYIWSNGYDASNDNGGLCIDDEGVTVFGAGDAANNFTAVFRVINEDNVAAGPMFYVQKNGNCYGVNFYSTSDRAKKQNISSFSEHIRKFQLKSTEKWHYGVIAQEVEEMFREGEEGNMTVNYNSVLSYYIGELENKVQKLEDEIKQLKGNNKWLH